MQYLKDAVINEDTTAPGLQAAREKLAYMSMTDKERRAYDDYMISVHAAKDAYDTARSDGYKDGWHEGREEGLEKGRVEGLEKGREEGLEKGLEKGREEGIEKNKRDNARRMKADGMPQALIAKYTGLTTAEIEQL